MENLSLKEAALRYAENGMPVFPVVFKNDYPIHSSVVAGSTELVQVENWWKLNCNIGMPTGTKSGVIVLRFCSEDAFVTAQQKGIPLTPIATHGKGYDVYFKYQDGLSDLLDIESLEDVTLVAEGRYVLAPPSVIELQPASPFYKPDVYSWYEGKSLVDVELAEVPNWMLRADCQVLSQAVTAEENVIDVVLSTERKDSVVAAEMDPNEQISVVPSIVNNPEEEWIAPKLFDGYHLDEIKADVLPSWLGDYARAISESKQTPEGLAVMLGLSMIATCVQKKFVVAPYGDDDYIEPLSLWTMTVMKSGERKSPVLNALREPLVAWQMEQAELLRERVVETATAISIDKARIEKLHRDASIKSDATERQNLINLINEIKRSTPAELKAPVLWTGDVTAEELQDMLVEHGERMSLLSDEGNIFAVMAGLYNNDKINIDIFLQAYSGAPTRIDRRSRKAELKSPALTFGIAVQPTVIESFATGSKKHFRDKGTLARFLYCIPDTMLGKRDSGRRVRVPEDTKARYQDGIKRLLSIPTPAVPQMLTLDDEAYEIRLALDRMVEKMIAPGGELEEMGDWGAKLPGNMVRIAGLMHLVENGPEHTVIGKATLDKAVQLCELLIQHAKAAFGMAGAVEPSADAKKVFEWLKKQEFKDFTKSSCYDRFKTWKKEKLDVALTDLEKRSIIRPIPELTSGRTATRYISNPALK